MFKIENNIMYLTKGDNAHFKVSTCGYETEPGDTLTFTIKQYPGIFAYVSKTVAYDEEFELVPSDTASMVPDLYMYDVQLNKSDGKIYTIGSSNLLRLLDQITGPNDIIIDDPSTDNYVISINNKTGVVVLTPNDIGAVAQETLAGYTTKQYVDNAIAEIERPDLSAYSTTIQMNAAIASSAATKQNLITAENKLNANLISGLSAVATSNLYSDLSEKPTLGNLASKNTVEELDLSNELQATINGKQDIITFNTTYSAASNKAATMTDIDNAIGAISGIQFVIVTQLPASGNPGTVYLLQNGTAYDQYIWYNNNWVQIGTTSIDLSEYAQKTWVQNQGYQTAAQIQVALATKQNLIDSSNKLSAGYVSGLSAVATSGSYNDLLNKPTIPTYTAGTGISITDNVISLNIASADTEAF